MNCPICQREVPDDCWEDHHLIPKCICKRNKYAELPQLEKGNRTVSMCIDCGDQLHQLFTEKELADVYNTVESILKNPDVKKWARWISKKPSDFGINMKSKKRRL